MHCQTSRDERRQECFKRIRELENGTCSNITDASLIESETEPSLTGISWNFDGLFQSRREEVSRSVLHTSKEQVERGWQQAMPRDLDMTASIQGVGGIAPYLLRRAMVGFKKGAQKETAASHSQLTRMRQKGGSPTPEMLSVMRMILDFSTHHRNFPVPLDPQLAHFVAAKEDAYIPRGNITDVHSLWPGGHLQEHNYMCYTCNIDTKH